MQDVNKQNFAMTGAIFVVALTIGLSVWYAGNVEAEDAAGVTRQGGQPGSPLANYQLVEEQVSAPDKGGNVFIEEDEVDLDQIPSNTGSKSQGESSVDHVSPKKSY